MSNTDFIKESLSKIGYSPDSFSITTVGGGSINRCYKVSSGKQSFFCKLNSARSFPRLFEKEASGLETISHADVIKTPKVLGLFENDTDQLLLLEYIQQGPTNTEFWRRFGEELAALHTIKGETFGLFDSNYMGSLEQLNTPGSDWISFFVDNRLRPQVELAVRQKLLQKEQVISFEHLYEKLDEIFGAEVPSLLHGDLWSGNFICNRESDPYLIDPAVYYGSRHMDLAMTTLFGGFDRKFYESYGYHYAIPSNHREIWDICNLYPLLVHLNLFGKSYLAAIISVINRF